MLQVSVFRAVFVGMVLSLSALQVRADLATRFHSEQQVEGNVKVDPGVQWWLYNRTVILVGGFMNETVPDRGGKLNGFFADTTIELRNNLGATRVRRINPNSLRGVHANADLLVKTWRDQFEAGGRRPLILVGHSKGAAEVLISVLRNPELITSGIVDEVILVQGAFYGSPLADVALPFAFAWSGLRSMGKRQQSGLMNRELEASRANGALAAVSSSIYFVSSWEHSEQLGNPHSYFGRYLQKFFGDNDGIVLTEDQKVLGIGRDLGTLKASHVALLGSQYSSGSSSHYKRAFTRALMSEVYHLRKK